MFPVRFVSVVSRGRRSTALSVRHARGDVRGTRRRLSRAQSAICAVGGHENAFRAFEPVRSASGRRARRGASESSASHAFQRSSASRDASASRRARARPRDPRRAARSKRGCATEGYEARRLIWERGARKRNARAHPVERRAPGHDVLVVAVDERHGADSGGVRRARGSAVRRATKVNSFSAQPTETTRGARDWRESLGGDFGTRAFHVFNDVFVLRLHRSRYASSRALAAATSSGSSEFSSTARHTSYLFLSLSAEAGEDEPQPHEGTGAGAPTS